MARKAIVDREKVLQLLREGKSSGNIASQFGVSRQAIDLHRKEFVRTGMLEPNISSPVVPKIESKPPSTLLSKLAVPKQVKSTGVNLDQLIDLLIQSLAALKKLPELEKELLRLRQQNEKALSQIIQLEEREQKRLEQEARWREVQQPSNTNQ